MNERDARRLKDDSEVYTHNAAFRKDLIELLRKYELPAAIAVNRLQVFCEEILCHLNTRDLTEYEPPREAILREYHAKKAKLAKAIDCQPT